MENLQSTWWLLVRPILIDDWGFDGATLSLDSTIFPKSNLSWMDWRELLDVISDVAAIPLSEPFPPMISGQDLVTFLAKLGPPRYDLAPRSGLSTQRS